MSETLRHSEAEFTPAPGQIGRRQSLVRRGVNGVMDGVVETSKIGGNVVGRTIHAGVLGSWHLARGLMNKHL